MSDATSSDPPSNDSRPNESESQHPDPARRRVPWRLAAAVVVLAGAVVFSDQMSLFARELLHRFGAAESPAERAEPAPEPIAAKRVFSMRDLANHPERLLETRTTPSFRQLRPQFDALLEQYTVRQGQDDNFTVRVTDSRTDSLLEVFTLTDERARFESTRVANWGAIDQLRRAETRRLVDKYEARGIPRRYISVKWGRFDQVKEAREREAPYMEYELQLAEYLGLSLLATEIGTVETFNDDRLVSGVGARSRYQMMPYLLRKMGIHHYSLQTAQGHRVTVYEEWHPLLTMEPAFLVLRGYVNAVGHELPGISAYHTGPNNIYKLYRLYLTDDRAQLSEDSSVLDAYMWALTEGFGRVSAQTSFKTYSRGYVPSVYGSFKATENTPIDTSRTLRVERVELRDDERISLRRLLASLEAADLDWQVADSLSLYNKFRQINPHIDLPYAPDSVGVPTSGNVVLTDDVDRMPVRFFLPLGATAALEAAGGSVLDPGATFRFTPDTYRADPSVTQTEADRDYAALVERIERFGFNEANRTELDRLVARFEALARENPSHYRLAQLTIIRTHDQLWSTRYWRQLAKATEAATGTVRAPIQPTQPLSGDER